MSISKRAGALGFVAMVITSSWATTSEAQELPHLKVFDGGDSVIVVARGITTASQRITSRGDRIEVRLDANPGQRDLLVADETVKRVAITKRSGAMRLSVQLRHGRSTTETAARTAEMTSEPGHTRLRIYREPRVILQRQRRADLAARAVGEVRHDRAADAVGEENSPATLEGQAEVASDSTQIEAAPAEPEQASAPAASEPATHAGEPASHAGAPATHASAPAIQTPESRAAEMGPATRGSSAWPLASPGTGRGPTGGLLGSMAFAIMALVACAVLVWIRRRRGLGFEVQETLDIVASKNLGSKSRVVLLNAGDRELLLGVSDKGTQLLSQWRRHRSAANDKASTASQATGCKPRDADKYASVAEGASQGVPGSRLPSRFSGQARARPTNRKPSIADDDLAETTSPVLAGLLKLRAATGAVNDEVATGDPEADAEWARELYLAAKEAQARAGGNLR